jgi:hypothetical protein
MTIVDGLGGQSELADFAGCSDLARMRSDVARVRDGRSALRVGQPELSLAAHAACGPTCPGSRSQ